MATSGNDQGGPSWGVADLGVILMSVVTAVTSTVAEDWRARVGIAALYVVLSLFWLYLRWRSSSS